ncbi:hypothetical protein SAMN05216223_106228 [Actinacidiphila yanglinensis]|uniref:Regulatory protein n=1 Tax=Actinacidiphila yanglinensis TaxID=310779 RepID=A0A1H6B4J7_9ACTN|nr:hypothetical protein [Actinacidiphila yanglinensis]SEG55763.1 hypothetical protein SAMN05216223_106228 [Actinacidiphila yanglinensis]
MAHRTPRNAGLAALLHEADWSMTQCARAVNRAGQEAGMSLHYDQSAVSHWVGGTMPRAKVRPLIVEAFARKLRRPVTLQEAGLAVDGPATCTERRESVDDLLELGKADMDPSRRGVLTKALYSAALVAPGYPELAGTDRTASARPTTRVGAGEVAVVRSMTERIADILDIFGGGHARPMAAAFLVNTVSPYLRADATSAVRANMLSAASDLVYLTGWMAMYEREHGLGQRYYVKALSLAGAAEDHVTYCRTLRGMSLQAGNLGYGSKALGLADAAAEASPKAGPRLHAFLAGQQAASAAMTGDRGTAFTRLAETEKALSKADSRKDAVGGYDLSAFLFHTSAVLCSLGDLPGSVEAMQDCLRAQPEQERQGRVHALGLLAQRQLELGHLDAACATWSTFLSDYEQVSSSRGDEHFDGMRRMLRSHRTSRSVRELAERVRRVAAVKGTAA